MNKSTTPRHHIWLVEDNARYRDSMQELVAERFVAVPFESCEEAVDALEHGHVPEVVLMDIELPGMNGIDGVRRIKAAAPRAQVIMLTMHEGDDSVFEAICAGASGYLLKSASADEVLQAIDLVLGGGAPIDAHVARRMLTMFRGIAAPAGDYGLTARETEILTLLVGGLTKQQIADRLFLSFNTIDTHIRSIYGKLHVHSRSDAVGKAVRERLV
ncbi:MAG TPA: response regulator transcription factor [Rhodothermales bacterium]